MTGSLCLSYSIFDLLKSSYGSFDLWMEWILEGAEIFPSTFGVVFFEGENNETTNTTNHIDLYKG